MSDILLCRPVLESIGHVKNSRCPTCGNDLSRTALAEILHTWEECACEADPCPHLIEQAWHRWCYVQSVLRSSSNGE